MNRIARIIATLTATLAASCGAMIPAHAGDVIEMNTHGVVTLSTLPHCKAEDGSGRKGACSWNIGTPENGNGKGLAYYFAPTGERPHYVWASSPIRGERRWLTYAEVRKMRPEMRVSLHCWIRVGDTTVIRCANGTRYVS